MKTSIEDIRVKLLDKQYNNEEHIRFSLVGRVLQEIGWDIWNPREVYTEYPAVKSEDNTRVDIALFSRTKRPDVYIEIKSHSKIETHLPAIEKQLRDYNRNNQANFTVITDGQKWLFYLSSAQGEFSDRKYHEMDILDDDIQEVMDGFLTLLAKKSIESGDAKQKAEEYLNLSIKERDIRDSTQEATKRMEKNPFLSRIKAIQEVLLETGVEATDDEIDSVLKKVPSIVERNRQVAEKKEVDFNPRPSASAPPPIQGKSNRTAIKVNIDGKEFYQRDAIDTFKEVVIFLGVEKVFREKSVKSKWPIVVSKNQAGTCKPILYGPIGGDYCVYKNTNNDAKKNLLEQLGLLFGKKITVEIVPK